MPSPLPSPPPLPEVHHHPTPLKTLAPHLLPHLPHSLPLLRRLQHTHTHSLSPLTLATFPPHPTTTTDPPAAFAALYADRARAPETESWIFSTRETSPDDDDDTRAHLLALFYYVATRVPAPHGKHDDARLMVVGTVNECLLPLLVADEGELRGLVPQKVVGRYANAVGRGVLGGVSVVYVKWVFGPVASAGGEEEEMGGGGGLPQGYRFGDVESEELGWVRGRSEIPRREETLRRLGCVGVRYFGDDGGKRGKGVLVGWAFLGVDGSLTHLHVEVGHRGKGLGKAVARRLFERLRRGQEEMGFRSLEGGGGGEGWADSDVAEDNLESAGVATALGGKVGWKVRWVGVNLDRVKAVVTAWERGEGSGRENDSGGGCQS